MTTAEIYSKRLGYLPLRLQTGNKEGEVNPLLTPVLQAKSPGYGSFSTLLLTPIRRTAGKVFGAGSVPSSVFNLCSATLGAGSLSLPYAFMRCGVTVSCILLLLAAFASSFSIHLLLRCRDVTMLSSYEDLSVHLFGPRMANFAEINIIVFCFGCCVAYIVAVGDILNPVAARLFGPEDIFSNPVLLKTVFVCLLMLPLSLLEQISQLSFASFIGVSSIGFLCLVTIIKSCDHVWGSGQAWQELSEIKWVNVPGVGISDIFTAVPIIMFAFNSQVNVFSIYTELRRPTIRQMNSVVTWSLILCGMCYLFIGGFGYLHFGNSTQPDLLKNVDINDPLVAISQAFVALTVTLAYPLNVFPARFALEVLCFNSKESSKLRHVLWTVFLVAASLLFALVIPGISTIFGLLGSTTSVVVAFVLPAIFYLKVFTVQHGNASFHGAGNSEVIQPDVEGKVNRRLTRGQYLYLRRARETLDEAHVRKERIGAWILLISGIICGVVSVSVSVAEIIQQHQVKPPA